MSGLFGTFADSLCQVIFVQSLILLILERLDRKLKKDGIIRVLKSGLSIDDAHLVLLYPYPINNLNPEINQRFSLNRFSVTRQVHYSNSDPLRRAFAHSKALNKARSQLTVAAFDLHQAWFLEACNTGFKNNRNLFNDCIKGEIPDKDGALAIWQSFFMLVPVVSSTFASVAAQFKIFGANEIGWLFIDEAGQASPQQAVGALLRVGSKITWHSVSKMSGLYGTFADSLCQIIFVRSLRSNRVVAVGDPLQIEPVFTIPPKFVDRMGREMLGDKAEILTGSLRLYGFQ